MNKNINMNGIRNNGDDNITNGSYSHSNGMNNKSLGNNTFTQGENNIAIGENTFVSGEGNIGLGKNQFISGTYNDENKDALVVIGNGLDEDNRSNAYILDKDGNATFSGNITINGDENVVSAKDLSEINTNIENINTELTNVIESLNNSYQFKGIIEPETSLNNYTDIGYYIIRGIDGTTTYNYPEDRYYPSGSILINIGETYEKNGIIIQKLITVDDNRNVMSWIRHKRLQSTTNARLVVGGDSMEWWGSWKYEQAIDTTPTLNSTNPVMSGGVKTELDNKVDKTQYASTTQAGIIKLRTSDSGKNISGISIDENGNTFIVVNEKKGITRSGSNELRIEAATIADIDARSNQYNPIVPSTLDYAVKSVTGNDLQHEHNLSQIKTNICYDIMQYENETFHYDNYNNDMFLYANSYGYEMSNNYYGYQTLTIDKFKINPQINKNIQLKIIFLAGHDNENCSSVNESGIFNPMETHIQIIYEDDSLYDTYGTLDLKYENIDDTILNTTGWQILKCNFNVEKNIKQILINFGFNIADCSNCLFDTHITSIEIYANLNDNIDIEPIKESNNLITSGAVYDAVHSNYVYDAQSKTTNYNCEYNIYLSQELNENDIIKFRMNKMTLGEDGNVTLDFYYKDECILSNIPLLHSNGINVNSSELVNNNIYETTYINSSLYLTNDLNITNITMENITTDNLTVNNQLNSSNGIITNLNTDNLTIGTITNFSSNANNPSIINTRIYSSNETNYCGIYNSYNGHINNCDCSGIYNCEGSKHGETANTGDYSSIYSSSYSIIMGARHAHISNSPYSSIISYANNGNGIDIYESGCSSIINGSSNMIHYINNSSIINGHSCTIEHNLDLNNGISYSTILSGYINRINYNITIGDESYSMIINGYANTLTDVKHSIILGGYYNKIYNEYTEENTDDEIYDIYNNNVYSLILGGKYNFINSSKYCSIIGGFGAKYSGTDTEGNSYINEYYNVIKNCSDSIILHSYNSQINNVDQCGIVLSNNCNIYNNGSSNNYDIIIGSYGSEIYDLISNESQDQYGNYSRYSSVISAHKGKISGNYSSIIGGSKNVVYGNRSIIIGGQYNNIGTYNEGNLEDEDSTNDTYSYTAINNSIILNSYLCKNNGDYNSIISNNVSELNYYSTYTCGYSSIIGGKYHAMNGYCAIILGGQYHTIDGENVIIVGGHRNNAYSNQVVMGHYNYNEDDRGDILDTDDNTISKYVGSLSGTNGSALIVGNGTSSSRSNCFRVQYDSNVYTGAGGTYNTTGADYAELTEWQDGNPDKEDRIGHFVCMVGDKMRIANSKDNKNKIGILSAVPAVCGDNYDDNWHKKYLTDVYGRPLKHTVHHDAIIKHHDETIEINEETGEEIIKEAYDEIIQEAYDSEEYILNSNYDPTQKYIPREQRPEYDYFGMVGKLIVMDDGTCQEDGYCFPNDNGIATYAEDGFYVMKRIDENHIKVLLLR